MKTKEKTCAERIGQKLENREQYLAELYAKAGEGDITEQDEAFNTINEMHYGIEVAKVYRVIWSGGGPADWIEITCDQNETMVKVEYVYQDWFDGAKEEVKEGSAIWRYAEDLLEVLES